MTISALIVAKNEELFIGGCLERILPYVEEVIFVDNASTDRTREIVESLNSDKIRIFEHPETDDMGQLRQFSLDQATQEFVWQIDGDEWYDREACVAIRKAVTSGGPAISYRVGYHQLSWRDGFEQKGFKHYPDRLYKREVVDRYDGLLPNDMTKVKEGYYRYRPFMEYDNRHDKSYQNSLQPILPVKYWHLARTRGYNYEYKKWYRYNKIGHPDWDDAKLDATTRVNQWVSGLYELSPVAVPFEIPKAKPKVSVIIPNFQYAEYVGLAIQSVLDQYEPAHEIIVVDDGSLDNSRKIIKHYPVTLIEIPNGGVANARNMGAMKATGDYLIFLDADDELAPDFIEKTVAALKPDTQVVYTDLQFIGDQQGVVGYPEMSLDHLRRNQCIPSACALVDRRVFEQVGGFDNNEWYEDYGWWLRIATKGFRFRHVKEPLFRYRKHGASRINHLDEKQVEGFKQLRDRYGKICG